MALDDIRNSLNSIGDHLMELGTNEIMDLKPYQKAMEEIDTLIHDISDDERLDDMDFDKLKERDAGFSINKDWNIEFAIPQYEDDDTIEDHVLYVSALAVLTRYEDFRDYVMERFHKEIGDIKEDE